MLCMSKQGNTREKKECIYIFTTVSSWNDYKKNNILILGFAYVWLESATFHLCWRASHSIRCLNDFDKLSESLSTQECHINCYVSE